MNCTFAAPAVGIAVGLLIAGTSDTTDIIKNEAPRHNNSKRVIKYEFLGSFVRS